MASGVAGCWLVSAVLVAGELCARRAGDLPAVREMIDIDEDDVNAAIAGQRVLMNATGPNTVRLLPPLTIDDDEVAEAITRVASALADHVAHS